MAAYYGAHVIHATITDFQIVTVKDLMVFMIFTIMFVQ